MTLFTFGDSHSYNGWNFSIPNLHIRHGKNGAFTMARFGLEKLNLIDIKKEGVQEKDAACFCFGEIDCRSHLCKPQNLKNYEFLINEIVFRYFEAIKINVEQYKDLIIMIYPVLPTSKYTSILNINPAFPHVGADEERKLVVLNMNKQLKICSEKYKYFFVDVYDKYCDNEGYLNIKFTNDFVHINTGIYVENYINSIIKND